MLVLYTLLVLGAVTTLYPFLTMITIGFKGPTDQNDNRLIPLFWTDTTELYTKYTDDKFSGDKSQLDSLNTTATADPALVKQYETFLLNLPATHWRAGFRTAPNQVTSKLTQRYQSWLRTRFKTIDELNQRYLELNTTFNSVAPPAENWERPGWSPNQNPKWQDFLEFKATLPADYRVPIRAQRIFQEWLRTTNANQMDKVDPAIKGDATAFEQIEIPASGPLREQFFASVLPARYRNGNSTEELWAKIAPGPLPILAYERQFVQNNAAEIRREFNTRNYTYVLNYILLNGRALWNTAIFCALAILTQLTINPIAAYALSRYPMKATARILLFLLATMAFPAEVAMIPSFLLLKDLHLLNTFWALILPAAANGYMIFLLKGFFDSLPQELFESGQLDGAKEHTMMLKLAIPLSKPVLGYLALLAFMGAYGAFLYAFLVAQDQRMWTLMVFIYQLQQSAPKAVMMAAVTLAAIPTLVVFLFAQRTIMRGIVLPGER